MKKVLFILAILFAIYWLCTNNYELINRESFSGISYHPWSGSTSQHLHGTLLSTKKKHTKPPHPDNKKVDNGTGLIIHHSNHPTQVYTEAKLKELEKSLPKYWNWSLTNPGNPNSPINKIIGSPRNQMKCGSCWAFAITGVLSDRLAIHQNKPAKILSVQYMIDCVTKTAMGCCGGMITPTVDALMLGDGIPLEKDYPYTSTTVGESACKRGISYDGQPEAPSTVGKCHQFKPAIKIEKESDAIVNITTPNTKESERVPRIKAELKENGPLVFQMSVFDTFYKYNPKCKMCTKDSDSTCICGGASIPIKECQFCIGIGDICYCTNIDGKTSVKAIESSVYVPGDDAKVVGGHAIELVGWSDEYTDNDGDKHHGYWIVKNSWGPTWGINGYFLLPMGENIGNVEQNVVAIYPKLTNE